MSNEKSNQHGGPCAHCGAFVPAGAGRLVRREDADGNWRWKPVHVDAEACESAERGAQGADRPSESPKWAVPRYGRTQGGLMAHGYALVTGPAPADAVPVNDAAREEAAPGRRRGESVGRYQI